MPGAKREFNDCGKVMRSDNLKNHKRICKGLRVNSERQRDNMGKSFHCTRCDNVFESSQSLWKHNQHCKGQSQSDVFKTISAMVGDKPNIPPMKKSKTLQPLIKKIGADGRGFVNEKKCDRGG